MSDMGETIFGFILGALVVGTIAWGATESHYTKQAIKHGAAEYVIVNKETGAVEFRWKECK